MVHLLFPGDAAESAAAIDGVGDGRVGPVSGRRTADGVSRLGDGPRCASDVEGRGKYRACEQSVAADAADDCGNLRGARGDAAGSDRRPDVSIYAAVGSPGAAAGVARGADAERVGYRRRMGPDSDVRRVHATAARRGEERHNDWLGK